MSRARLQRQIRADLAASERYAARAVAGLAGVPNAHERLARRYLAEARAIRRQARALRLGAGS